MEGVNVRIGLVLVVSQVTLYCGCARQTAAPVRQAERAAWAEPVWGPATEGLQCRLRPAKRLWRSGETPVFKADLRNHGKRTFAFVNSERVPLSGISVDDRWYPYPTSGAVQGRVWPLAPDVEFTNLPVSLPTDMQLSLAPGPHIIRVAFSFEGVEVVSNVVGIEILASP